jgi:hypothetical protein
MADAPETGPASARRARQVEAMQLERNTGSSSGCPHCHPSHPGKDEKYPAARTHTRVGAPRDTGGIAAKALLRATKRRPARDGSAYASYHVRSSGRPGECTVVAVQACETSKQTTEWALRKNANVQPAPKSRQHRPETFEAKAFSSRPVGFDEPREQRQCRGRNPSDTQLVERPA